MSTKKFTLAALLPELSAVIESKEFVVENLTVSEAYFLLQACQITAINPNLGVNMIDRFVALGRELQNSLQPFVSRFFAEFIEAGWNRELDE